MRHSPLAAAIALLFPLSAAAADATLGEVVVTAPRMLEPLTVATDPKAPQQPVPANDGAAFLKNVPGFTMIRKGGTDGDPVLRGLAGSRLNILVDGAELLGGCGMRMDPPTAYIFPETFDSVTVLKGPQSVSHGNGNLAGVVLFDRDERKAAQPGARGFGSLMLGSWGRLDAVAGGTYAGKTGYLQATASHAQSDDYEDGRGNKVHSDYERQSLNAKAGWNIDASTRLSVDAVGSRAEAAYADRGMDGVKFDREGYGVKFEKDNLSPLLARLSAQAYYNYIDHVMDNYSLRTKAPGAFMVNNPDRETQGLRLAADLALSDATLLKLGADWQGNDHTLRTAMGGTQALADAYVNKARVLDMQTNITGLYGEVQHGLDESSRLIGGLRLDDWSADRYNSATGAFMASAGENLTSGFVRYERDLAQTTVFVGLGHGERPMDYWEASTYNGLTPATQIQPEQNTQLDAGLIWKTAAVSASLSAFYGKMDDYILTRVVNITLACSAVNNCQTRNVDATRYGGEADLAWRFAPNLTLRGSLAYVHADNDTMNVPLAQTPPLEGRLGLDWGSGPWTAGGVLRMVASQDRVHVGLGTERWGNIVGQDIGPTAGFATLALNGSYQAGKKTLLSLGVDNVFDKAYAEHISRNGSAIAGFATNTRVTEPGRFFWAKLNLAVD